MRLAPRAHRGQSRLRAAIEGLESRQLLTAYFVDTDVALAAINSKNLVAGDQVLLKSGQTFTGNLRFDINDKGTAANPIVVSSYNASTGLQLSATAAASSRATIFAGGGKGIDAYNAGGLSISALNIVGAGASKNAGAGIFFYNDLAGNVKLTGVSIDHVNVSGFHDAGISIGGWNGTSGYSGVRISYADVYNNGNMGMFVWGKGGSASTGYSNSNFYIGHSKFHDNAGIAGTSSNSGNGVVISGVSGATIEYCLAYNNGANNTAVGGPVGIWAYAANAVTIQYSESHHNRTNSAADGGGFDLDGGVTNSAMQYNYSHDNDGAGYGLYEYSGASTWANNVVRGNVSVNDGLKNGYYAIHFWTAGGTMSNTQITDNQVIKADAKYLYIPSGGLVSGVVTSGNVFNTSGTPDLTGIGLSGPASSTTTVTTATPTDTTSSTSSGTTSTSSSTTTTVTVSDPVTTAIDTSTTTTTTTTTTTKHKKKHRKYV